MQTTRSPTGRPGSDVRPPTVTVEKRPRPVLVIEDAADIRESLRELLETEGYPVFTAANGALGLETLESMSRPCLILLDLMMPVMDGFEFLDALKDRPRHHPRAPVVLVTANRSFEVALRSPNVVGVLTKPFELDRLMDMIEEHCGPPLN